MPWASRSKRHSRSKLGILYIGAVKCPSSPPNHEEEASFAGIIREIDAVVSEKIMIMPKRVAARRNALKEGSGRAVASSTHTTKLFSSIGVAFV